MILEGKRLLITGVITKDSIAYHVAEQAQREGAVGGADQLRAGAADDRAGGRSGCRRPVDVLELDVNKPDDLAALTEALGERWGASTGSLHAIAFAPEDALGGQVHDHSGRERGAGVPDERVLAEGAGARRWRR